MGWRAILVSIILLTLCASPAQAQTTLEYRYWTGFYGSTSFELRYEPSTSPLGFRLWSAHGWDDDHCKSRGECSHNTFAGGDLTYQISPSTRLYFGFQNLDRTLAVNGNHYTMYHTGFRIGVMGTVPLSAKLTGVYDAAFVPQDRFANTWDAGIGSGGMYRIGLRHQISEQSYLETGWWSFGFNLPNERCCGFDGHKWLGSYISVGARF